MDNVKDSIQQVLDKEAEIAKDKEILIGIDPKSYLGKEILKMSRVLCELRGEIHNLNLKLERIADQKGHFNEKANVTIQIAFKALEKELGGENIAPEKVAALTEAIKTLINLSNYRV